KVQDVNGGNKGPLTVRLEPLGTLTGRVVDADGQPLAAYKIAAFPVLSGKGYENLPEELRPFGRSSGFDEGAWYDLTLRRAVTNPEGRYSLAGLLPGVPYTVVAAEVAIRPGQPVTHQQGTVTVAAGQTKDLGDWKSKATQED